MAGEWVTVKEAGQIVGRSHHTVYNWIERTQSGRAKLPLVVRRSDKQDGKGWLILVKSLLKVEKGSPRYAKSMVRSHQNEANGEESVSDELPFNNARSVSRGGDTIQRVQTDRRKWVRRWVMEGKSLFKVLAVFSPELHDEIEWYYQQALADKREGKE